MSASPLAQTGPVRWDPAAEAFVVTGFEEAAAVLRGPGWSSDPRHSPQFSGLAPQRPPAALVFMDPPDHTRLRHLLGPVFTPRAMQRWRPRISAIAGDAVTTLPGCATEGVVDLIADLGQIVPLAVMAEVLEVGPEGAELFRDQTPRLVRLLEADATTEELADAADAATAVTLFLLPLVAERLHQPGDDLISGLLAIDGISPDEALTLCVQLLAGGHETTSNALANAVLALLRQPDQRARLLTDPDRGIEELLRVAGPVRQVWRAALTDQTVGGVHVPEGSQVFVRIQEANRDPRRFPDPDRLDLGRPGPGHLAFGGGGHFCVGAALARVQLAEVLSWLFRCFPDLRLAAGQPEPRRSTTFSGVQTLPVRLGPYEADHAGESNA